MLKKFVGIITDEDGQGMVEYGLILALVAVVVITALTLMGNNITTIFTNTANKIVAPSGS